mgnify:FL=1
MHKTETLGEKLRRRREELGFSLRDTARHIQISLNLLQALEEDKYEKFSAKVYALGYFKRLLQELAISEQEEWLKEFGNEWEVRMFRKSKSILSLPGNKQKKVYFTPAQFWTSLVVIFFTALLIFLGLKLGYFISAPEFILEEPKEQEVFEQPLVRVSGRTEKESQLTVNGRSIKIDGQGNFSEDIEIGAGLHTLEFRAQNRFGKESKEIRHILVK